MNIKHLLIYPTLGYFFFIPFASASDGYYFEPGLLEGNGEEIDLNYFEKSASSQPAGNYLVAVSINNRYIGKKMLNFTLDKKSQSLSACIPKDIIDSIGFNQEYQLTFDKLSSDTCMPLLSAVAYSQIDFDFAQQTLAITVPQDTLDTKPRGYIPATQWQSGIDTLFTNYRFSGDSSSHQSQSGQAHASSYFLSANSGINLGQWRLRNSSTWQSHDGDQTFDSQETYLQRDLAQFNSQLRLGNGYTSGDVFDAINLTGVNIRTDERMLPDSQQRYAPTIQGIAKTNNAKVIVEQNGYVIYHTYVNAGPFSITDLYPSSNGELSITIEEVDGSEQHFIQGYASVPMQQREGHLNYEVNLGKYRSFNELDVFQGQVAYGLMSTVTLYGGWQLTDGYRAMNSGVAFNLSNLGAFSFDITQANSDFNRYSDTYQGMDSSKGQSYRFLYANNFDSLGANFQLLGYRYATEGYYSLNDYAQIMASHDETSQLADNGINDLANRYGDQNFSLSHEKSQTQATLSKNFGSISLSLNMTDTNYWDTRYDTTNLSLALSGQLASASYNLSFSSIKNGLQDEDKTLFFSVSMPLDFGHHSSWLGYNASLNQGKINHQLSLSGELLDDHNLRYTLNQGYDTKTAENSGSASLYYDGQYTESQLAYSYDANQQRLSYGMNGSAVLTKQGLTLGQNMGSTNILVSIPGVEGVKFTNYQGVETDEEGNALLNYSTPYRQNKIEIDLNSLPDNIELPINVANVTPTDGALSSVIIAPKVGYKALFTLSRQQEQTIPFGANVTADDQATMAIVGDANQVYLSGLNANGKLSVKWGEKASQMCQASYQLPVKADFSQNPRVFILSGECK